MCTMNLHEGVILCSVACYCLYGIFYGVIARRTRFLRAKVDTLYERWVDTQLQLGQPIVTVQAIRNLLMTDSIFISALFIALGIFPTVIFDLDSQVTFSLFGWATLSLVETQATGIITLLVVCLFNFMLSLRYYNRLHLLLTAHSQENGSFDPRQVMGRTLMLRSFVRGQRHYMWGNKMFYFLLAAITWLFNPLVCIILTLGITLFLMFFDDIGDPRKEILEAV